MKTIHVTAQVEIPRDPNGRWQTSSNNVFEFSEGGPIVYYFDAENYYFDAENRATFCQYCGRRVEVRALRRLEANASGEFRRDSGVGSSPLLGQKPEA